MDQFGDRLYAIHMKDFVFDRNGTFEDVVVGEGSLDLPALLAAFKKLPFDGSACVEYEGEDAVEASARCVEAVRTAWAD